MRILRPLVVEEERINFAAAPAARQTEPCDECESCAAGV